MKKKLFLHIGAFTAGALILAAGVQYLFAASVWNDPKGPPPTQNAETPLNVGMLFQTKEGNISLKSLTASKGIYVRDAANVSAPGNGGDRASLIFGGKDSNLAWYLGAVESKTSARTVLTLWKWGLNNNDGYVQTWLPNGNVGIGTPTPTAALDVNGQIRIRGGNPNVGKVLTSDANGTASWQPVSSSFVPNPPGGNKVLVSITPGIAEWKKIRVTVRDGIVDAYALYTSATGQTVPQGTRLHAVPQTLTKLCQLAGYEFYTSYGSEYWRSCDDNDYIEWDGSRWPSVGGCTSPNAGITSLTCGPLTPTVTFEE